MKMPRRAVRVPAVLLATIGLCGIAWARLWFRAEDSWPVLFMMIIYLAVELATSKQSP